MLSKMRGGAGPNRTAAHGVYAASLLNSHILELELTLVSWRSQTTRGDIWDAIERVIAIVGCQRSGTTLTGQIIGALPQAFLVDEPDGLYPWFHAETRGRDEAASLGGAMIESAKAKYRSGEEGRDCGGVTVLVLKAPNLTYDVDQLARLPAPVSIVYPVRDPRAVVASMGRLGHIDFIGNQLRLLNDRPGMRERFAAECRLIENETQPRWIRQAAIWDVKSSMGPDYRQAGFPVTQFKYEDLVREPDRLISTILKGCHLSESDEARCSHDAYVGHGPGGTDRTRSIDAESLCNWETWLDERQQADVIPIAGASARNFGYV